MLSMKLVAPRELSMGCVAKVGNISLATSVIADPSPSTSTAGNRFVIIDKMSSSFKVFEKRLG